ncbi:HutD/Ves family protein [Brucella anthropi]|uniref:HutD/Ves family protein n=1 Tax=Brucella anthropi TaxID=529 RepID=UPI00244B2DBA|nr:HutD family protein [Brucella anthropi]MDG9788991.1 HutD family protein [Brucella anthropi]MDH0578870.1 HutD family protein [Brucella anthropi]MDH0815391.1 HutD family protein [Brucella anthropi]MDH2082237.1 HutD family protein [Brucella anthropi]
MMVEILKAESHRHMPWKNGGGVTVEIAVHPEGASVDNFDWRISMATVASDGPFSIFPGIDRTLSVLEGDGILLDVEGQQSTLTCESVPLFFAADAQSSARLIGSAITDLNVMTRRGRFAHMVRRLPVNGTTLTQANGNLVLLFCAEGQIDLTLAAKTTKLEQHDCAVSTNCDALPLELKGKGAAYLISISPI